MVVVVVLLVIVVVALGGALLQERRRRTQVVVPPTSPTPRERLEPSADEDRLRAALEAITQGVVVVADNGQVLVENAFAGAYLRGRHGHALVAESIDEVLAGALRGELHEREVQLYGPPRQTLLVSARPIGPGGAPSGAVVLIDDVTEHERLDAMRRDFVANISHELRTPIGAMSLLAETLVGESDPETVQKLANRLVLESDRMGKTIEDLLELSRIEYATDEGHAAVTVQSVVREAVDSLRPAAEQRGVHVGMVMPEDPLLVIGDQRQLRSAVFNLVDNALKYSPTDVGTVSVRARQLEDLVEIEVQDNGVGIPRRDLDRIFERFYRVDRGRGRGTGGTGLGLSIVRHVAANHGGRISVDSTEGEGSTFRLSLPSLVASNGTADRAPDGATN